MPVSKDSSCNWGETLLSPVGLCVGRSTDVLAGQHITQTPARAQAMSHSGWFRQFPQPQALQVLLDKRNGENLKCIFGVPFK